MKCNIVFLHKHLITMKKLFLLLFALCAISSFSFAQNAKSFYRSSYESRNSGSFSQGHSLLSFTYGFGNQFYPGYGGFYTGVNRFALGPVYVKYEHGFLRDEVGLGGHIAVSHGWVKYNSGERDNITAASFALLGFYHFNKLIPVRDLDVYVCAGPSFWNRAYKYDNDNPADDYTTSEVVFVGKVGVRYYMSSKFAFTAEAGWDQMSSVNLGITFKL